MTFESSSTTINNTKAIDDFAQLGITQAVVQQALEKGVAEYVNTTLTHPRTIAGVKMWGEIVKTLRDSLILKGWAIPNVADDPYSETNSPDGKWRLVVWNGDKYTGTTDSNKTPKSKNGKGGGTAEFINDNLSLKLDNPNESHENQQKRQTLAFIFHYDKYSKEVRSELSLPVGTEYIYSKDHPARKPKVSKYDWRVLFSPYDAGEIKINISNSKEMQEVDFTDDIDIEIGLK